MTTSDDSRASTVAPAVIPAVAPAVTPALDRVDELLVVVALRGVRQVSPTDAFVVRTDVPPEGGPDERRLLGVLAVLVGSLGPGTLWSLDVARRHEGAGAGQPTRSRADVRLDLVAPAGDTASVFARLDPLLREVRSLSPAAHRYAGRDEAITVAAGLVALVWGAGDAELRVSDEEHHPEQGGWTIGLTDGDVARYEVRLGVVDGDPHTAHLRRHAATEVADSIGESG